MQVRPKGGKPLFFYTGSKRDEVLAEFAVFGSTWDEALRALRERYEGLVDRAGVYGMDAADAEAVASAFRAAR